jgi:hypothetical protein
MQKGLLIRRLRGGTCFGWHTMFIMNAGLQSHDLFRKGANEEID